MYELQLEIVTHCYAIEFSHYATALKYQLSSLVHHPPKPRVAINICFVPEDIATADVVDWFVCNTNLNITQTRLSVPQISRRSIGRNLAALRTHAELLWHCDVDHVFGHGCIDGLWRAWVEQTEFVAMLYPEFINIHSEHVLGDAALDRDGWLLDINPDDFVVKRYSRAIGGVQVVPGSLARRYGYLNDLPQYQTPLDKPFSSFYDDVVYRRQMAKLGRIVPITIPNLYRIRHTQTSYQ